MARSNSKTVGKNFFWYALETSFALAAALVTTVAVARVIGPVNLGHFNYIYWLTRISGSLGSVGIPLTVFKYMGEYLGSQEKALARAVFFRCLYVQTLLASLIAVIGLGMVFAVGDPSLRTVSVLLVLGIVPQMITLIPSQANNAAENFSANTLASGGGIIINGVGTGLSLLCGWGLVGIAASVLVANTVELFAKLLPVLQWVSPFPQRELPAGFIRQLVSFAGRSFGMLVVQAVVWDRSDVILLRLLNADIRQLAFFSISFSMIERLLLIPQAFGQALASTQMAEYGRDKERLFRMTGTAGTYALMSGLPLLIGAACLAGPLLSLVYGPKYLPAIPVFAIAASFAVGRAVLAPGQTLLYSTDDLGFVLKCSAFCGVVNVAIDWLLIPGHGAIGAAIGNGTAQLLAAIGVWTYAAIRYPLRLQTATLMKIGAAAALMAASVLAVTAIPMPVIVRLIVGFIVGVGVYIASLRVLCVLGEDDSRKLTSAIAPLPLPLQSFILRIITFVIRQVPETKYDLPV
jgi:O-antigen/teichoic acid export membrane protein